MASKRVLLAAPRGYCAGVDRAVQTVEEALAHYGPPVYVRRQIVHNLHVVRSLQERGAIFVEELDEVPAGATVVFSAHGVAPSVHAEAAERELRTIDATCPLVTKVHNEVRRFAGSGHQILLIGHEGHEEVVGTTGEAPEQITLVDGVDGAPTTRGRRPEQADLAVADDAVGRRDDADRRRAQAAVPAAAGAAVGRHLLRDPEPAGRGQDHRAAGRPVPGRRLGQLVELGAHGRGGRRRPARPAAYLVENAAAIDPSWLAGVDSVGLSSGASVPEILVREALDYLAAAGFADVEEVTHTEERLVFALPQELRKELKTRD